MSSVEFVQADGKTTKPIPLASPGGQTVTGSWMSTIPERIHGDHERRCQLPVITT